MRVAVLKQGLRSLRRDLRAGDLTLLLLAVTLAVTALTAVVFFADRLQGGLQRDARQLLGGDVVVLSDQPTPAVFIDQARQQGLQASQNLAFPTMARAPDALGGGARLVALKAVDDAYPLRGTLRLAPAPGAPDVAVRAAPARGEVWVDAALIDTLGLQVGQPVLLGDAALRVAQVLVSEPDRGAGFLNFAPRVLMHVADLPATQLVQPASRIGYRFAVAGEANAVRAFTRWAETELARQADGAAVHRAVSLETLESGRAEVRSTLVRAEKFLSLVALLSALLSAVAVALAARSFAQRHLDACALLRVLGQSQRDLAQAYLTEFLLAGLAASAAGTLLGYLGHHAFVWLLSGLVDANLPAPGLWPIAFGLGVGLTLLGAFGLPPVLQLAQVPALRVLRRDVGNLRPASLAVLALGLAGFAALLLVVSADRRLGLIAVGGFAAAVVGFAALAWAALRLLRRVVPEERAPHWLLLATRQLAARPAFAVVQVSALAVGLLALALLVLLRTDLISSWRAATPPDAPNRFVINIQPDQAVAFEQTLREAGISGYDWYPMIRGRLVAINGRTVTSADYTEDRAQRLVEREFNLSHARELPSHNQLAGGLWQREEEGAVSVEEGIAKTLHLKLGDDITFDMGGQQKTARITSLRRVEWGSLRANFFVMYPVSQLADVPLTYMTAFRAPPVVTGQPGFDSVLLRRFPNVTSVDMSATLNQVQGVLGQVIRAVEFLFVFALATGLVVLVAAVSATREERVREFAIMRALGARGALLRQVQRTELVGVGLLAGALAGLAALVLGWALARYAFEFAWRPAPWVLLGTMATGGVLAWAAGWWSMRDVLRRPVVDTLRAAAE